MCYLDFKSEDNHVLTVNDFDSEKKDFKNKIFTQHPCNNFLVQTGRCSLELWKKLKMILFKISGE